MSAERDRRRWNILRKVQQWTQVTMMIDDDDDDDEIVGSFFMMKSH